ncbi:hypothetical protein AmaxDRAFT_3317 [Limnospira maxima CS-328]|uniref:Uncharacterized protein n=2 Tax=Limnospira TaxID=2596745 RepID=B5W3D9_LIMMA|nr:hypothetical protein AmaxDRAFT_3317 [Limnospira maxima CS-328]UWU48949.1 hypothetical protein APLC1_3760 [Arthrospira platensis C1]
MPNCNGWDMPTSHGVDIETATSRSAYDQSEFKDYVVYIAPKVEVIKQGVVTLFLLTIGYPHQEPCDAKVSSTVLNGSWGRRLPFRPLPATVWRLGG